ncbi:Cache 3/Cache 2 fusion domain-containing protein [Curvibacter sp. HBC61]|uniref:Cache 3/Cache 2 fusion domain-containing protein n=1 Tax=Curvibacter cyanobacteriorum TaxID=3026422 RepID=A0ABT5MUJ8_9BURK|nr:methyl-accepting chemotaxis protein [Curvibacter sp. HBC61]MDD0837512.1 Cache 3/Cache 2 fusion domain-containing protein [Curvibacter sp. HBC61]
MSEIRARWRDMSLGTKLSLSNFLLVLTVLTLLISAISWSVAESIEARATAEVQDKTQLLAHLVKATDDDLRLRTSELGLAFNRRLDGQVSLNGETQTLAGRAVPVMLWNGKPVNLDNSVVDEFSLLTKSSTTVFVRAGDDFVRISTSLKNEQGQRVTGTTLDRQHPAYPMALQGQPFVGLVSLFGRQYMTRYDPLKNAQGQVIGLSLVAQEFTGYLSILKKTIRDLKIGDTGYFYVLDAQPGPNYGQLVIHPVKEGQSMIAAKDANGREFIREILERKNGELRYPWINEERGETRPRDKVIAFTHFKEWNWVIAGGTYADEYSALVVHMRNLYAGLGLLMVLVISVLGWLVFRRLVVVPLADVGQAADQIAQGDLTVALKVAGRDEVGQLQASVNRIGQGLAGVVRSVRENSQNVATASAEIALGNQDLSGRTESQASALEQTAASMEELGSTVRQNAEHAREASQLALTASSVAARGGQVVSEVVDTMQGINDSSRRIADIIGVIDGIAFQTNILALNAAVEAARAGEQGRGFAVVASEVRSLARRSAEAAREIKTLINDSVERVEKGGALVHQAGHTMQEVVDSIQRVSAMVNEISTASTEQSAGVAQVGEAVTQMDYVTQQNAALVEEMAAAAGSLRVQADDLVRAVALFKVGGERAVPLALGTS